MFQICISLRDPNWVANLLLPIEKSPLSGCECCSLYRRTLIRPNCLLSRSSSKITARLIPAHKIEKDHEGSAASVNLHRASGSLQSTPGICTLTQEEPPDIPAWNIE